MCYARPGPRCSAHAREHLRNALAALEEFTGAADADINDLPGASRLRQDYEDALREYEETPDGQDMLRESLRTVQATAPEDTKAVAIINARLDRALAARAAQLEQYREAQVYSAGLSDLPSDEAMAIREAEGHTTEAGLALREAERRLGEDPTDAVLVEQAEFARFVAEQAEREERFTKAGVCSGFGPNHRPFHPEQPHHLDFVRQNPDGTWNVARYEPPSAGFIHGRFIAAVGLEGESHAQRLLVFADGRRLPFEAGQAGSSTLVLFESQSNAQPVRWESSTSAPTPLSA